MESGAGFASLPNPERGFTLPRRHPFMLERPFVPRCPGPLPYPGAVFTLRAWRIPGEEAPATQTALQRTAITMAAMVNEAPHRTLRRAEPEGNEGTLGPARGRRWWKKRGRKRRVRIQPRRGFLREPAARGPGLEGSRSETGRKNPWELQANIDGNIEVRDELDRRRKALESNHPRMANGKREGVQARWTAAGDDRLRRVRHRGWKVMAPEGQPRGTRPTRTR